MLIQTNRESDLPGRTHDDAYVPLHYARVSTESISSCTTAYPNRLKFRPSRHPDNPRCPSNPAYIKKYGLDCPVSRLLFLVRQSFQGGQDQLPELPDGWYVYSLVRTVGAVDRRPEAHLETKQKGIHVYGSKRKFRACRWHAPTLSTREESRHEVCLGVTPCEGSRDRHVRASKGLYTCP